MLKSWLNNWTQLGLHTTSLSMKQGLFKMPVHLIFAMLILCVFLGSLQLGFLFYYAATLSWPLAAGVLTLLSLLFGVAYIIARRLE